MAAMRAGEAGNVSHGAARVHDEGEFLRRRTDRNPARVVSAFQRPQLHDQQLTLLKLHLKTTTLYAKKVIT